MPDKLDHETVESLRGAGYNQSMSVSDQRRLRAAVSSGSLDASPEVKDAVARCAEGHERSGDRQVISQFVHRVSPRYDD